MLLIFSSFFLSPTQANALAKNLAISAGYGRIEKHQRVVRGVLESGRKPGAKPRLEAWLVSCGRSGLHLTFLLIGGGSEISE